MLLGSGTPGFLGPKLSIALGHIWEIPGVLQANDKYALCGKMPPELITFVRPGYAHAIVRLDSATHVF